MQLEEDTNDKEHRGGNYIKDTPLSNSGSNNNSNDNGNYTRTLNKMDVLSILDYDDIVDDF